MTPYIKHVAEAFDFNSVNKEKKKLNIFTKVYEIIKTPYNKLSEDDKNFIKGFNDSMPIIKVNNKKELKSIISRAIKLFGTKCNLNWIDVSNITDMSELFEYSKFNGDISQWDVSNVTNMQYMFSNTHFNGDISQWNVSNVTNMMSMFENSKFNGDISNWDVSNVTNMRSMFEDSKFNGDISNWDVSNVTTMKEMFLHSMFNGDLSKWNVGHLILSFLS